MHYVPSYIMCCSMRVFLIELANIIRSVSMYMKLYTLAWLQSIAIYTVRQLVHLVGYLGHHI